MFIYNNFIQLYVWSVFILGLFYSIKIYNFNNKQLLYNQNNFSIALLVSFIIFLFFGFRPFDSPFFGDTFNYAQSFVQIQQNPEVAYYDLIHNENKDVLFTLLMIFFTSFSDVSLFFIVISFFYVMLTLWSCKRLFPNNPYGILLVFLTSFSFLSYGVNGIRNGLALSFILLALSFINKNNKSNIIAIMLCLGAFGFHNSAALPAIMLFISAFFIKNFNLSLLFWIFSIFISLIFGNSVASVFEGLGFDDRLDKYITGIDEEELMESFSRSGFRWDFLLYSCIPIIIGYYVIIKCGIRNKTYELLLNTYTLSNAFWVMVITAAFSNRFAYLSWFMYPLVLSYPFFEMNIWNNQAKKVIILILGNALFLIAFFT